MEIKGQIHRYTTDGNQHSSIESDLHQSTKQLVFLIATNPAVEKGLFQGSEPFAAPLGDAAAPCFVERSRLSQCCCALCCAKWKVLLVRPQETAPKPVPEDHGSGRVTKLQRSRPGNAGWVCCARQPRTKRAA